MSRRASRAWMAAVLGASLAIAICAAPARAESLDYDQVYELAAEAIGHGPEAHYATRISFCESGITDDLGLRRWRPTARGAGFDAYYGWYDHRGLWQIAEGVWGDLTRRLYGPDASLFSPWVNAQMMAVIRDEQGWLAGWPYCSRNV